MVQIKKPPVYFHFLVTPFFFPNRKALQRFIYGALKRAGREVETINYIFCDDAYLIELNKTYLNHNTYTDIISFELSPKGAPLVSDIFISVERVKENAQTFQTSFIKELHRVVFHGALHLAGLKDKKPKEIKEMRKREKELLDMWFHGTQFL